jgi:glycine cleavage system H lipoate-binding protein
MNPADIFATKGIEYLILIGFLGALVVFWRLLSRPSPQPALAQAPVARHHGWFEVREPLLYHPGHTWALPRPDGLFTVGVDDFAQKLLGEADTVRLPEVGAGLEQGAPGWHLRVDGKDVDLLSPVDGIVLARNEKVLAKPALLNDDPYGDGWLLKVKPTREKPNLVGLLHGDLAREWMREAEDTLRRRVSPEIGLVLQDGGVPICGIAQSVSPQGWTDLAKELLLTA